jgi:hypothetical protein
MSTAAQRERNRYAALRRSRPAGDPELLDTQRRMQEEALIGAVGRALKNGPPVTGALRARIVDMLADGEGSRA